MLAQIVAAGAKLLEVGELDERLRALETVQSERGEESDVFDDIRP